jgi:nitrite reductase (NADH) large subunit
MKNIVIIGSSAAGHSLAMQVRGKNKQCAITIVTEETYPCYDRRKIPAYFSGTIKEKDLFIAGWDSYVRENITVIKETRAVGVNCDRGTLHVKKEDKRESIPFDLLAICTGMKTIPPEIPGIRKEGIFTFGSLADVKAAKSTVINGPVCFFGEWNAAGRLLAQSLLSMKKELTLITEGISAELPAGVEAVNSTIIEFIGEAGLQAVKLREGKIIGTSFCVLTSPVAAATELLDDTDVKREGGFICVDNNFKTSRQNIFACGSVTGKCDSWDEALRQSAVLSDTLAALL